MHVSLGEAHQYENPGQHDEYQVGVARDDFQDRQHVEQHWQFELIAEAISDLLRAYRPVRLAQCDLRGTHRAAFEVAPAQLGQPQQQAQGQRDLDEQRQQNGLDRHMSFLSPRRGGIYRVVKA
jgi:hypothetical protein